MQADDSTEAEQKSEHCRLNQTASLYVVATPIGNLGDLSLRARSVLEQVDKVAAEDTRNTARLLEALGIQKPLLAHHAHNEKQSAEGILACLERGESVALVSDAGTPAVSDPGAWLVQRVAQAGYPVVPLPGASSVMAVLCASGMVDGPFTFRGFLPAKGKSRLDDLKAWLDCAEPQILFEAPHRIVRLMDDLLELGQTDRRVCAGRELTKQFETFYRGTVQEVSEQIREDAYAEKGEWALVFAGAEIADDDEGEQNANLTPLIEEMLLHLPAKTVTQILVKSTGLPKNQLYQQVLSLKEA